MKFNPKFKLLTQKIQITKARIYEKNGGRRSILYDFSRFDSRDISSKKKEFLSEDAINVSTNGEDATQCCNPVNPAPKQWKSLKAQDDVGLSERELKGNLRI